ncbi:hypothetical protein JXI42_04035 [bacterium]|nr:hypothetical protein [bacterium]
MEGSIVLLIPILAVGLSLSIPIVALVLLYKKSKLKTQERLAAIEKGIPIPQEPEKIKKYRHPIYDLRSGLICLFIGIALLVFANFVGTFTQPDSDDFVAFNFIGLAGGLILAGIGLGKLIWYFIARKKLPPQWEENEDPKFQE